MGNFGANVNLVGSSVAQEQLLFLHHICAVVKRLFYSREMNDSTTYDEWPNFDQIKQPITGLIPYYYVRNRSSNLCSIFYALHGEVLAIDYFFSFMSLFDRRLQNI